MTTKDSRLSRYRDGLALTLGEVFRDRKPLKFRNREGLASYDFALRSKVWRKGVSAMLRVKNEEQKILHCLSSILDVFDEVVLVDNGSTDATPELVRNFKSGKDHHDRISVFSYPFRISRCGEEHRQTAEDSVHSLAYYYNWCLSRCSYSYVFKIDADMVVLPDKADRMRSLLRTLSPFHPTIVRPSVQTTYRSLDGRWFLAKGDVYREPRLFPNTAAIHYCKAGRSEGLVCGIRTEQSIWSEILLYELKDTSEEEFLHWSDTNFETERKRQEWRNFNLVKSGDVSGSRFIEITPSFLKPDY